MLSKVQLTNAKWGKMFQASKSLQKCQWLNRHSKITAGCTIGVGALGLLGGTVRLGTLLLGNGRGGMCCGLLLRGIGAGLRLGSGFATVAPFRGMGFAGFTLAGARFLAGGFTIFVAACAGLMGCLGLPRTASTGARHFRQRFCTP